jgi:hypothetical protein
VANCKALMFERGLCYDLQAEHQSVFSANFIINWKKLIIGN